MARHLYTPPAEGQRQGDAQSGGALRRGHRRQARLPDAAQWFRKAADHGIADSQYNLGILYARGIGVEQNLPESYKWFALAARADDKESVKKRDDSAAGSMQGSMAARGCGADLDRRAATGGGHDVKTPAGGWERRTACGRQSRSRQPGPEPIRRAGSP